MVDTLETMRAELDEAVELMHPHFPNDSECDLLTRAENWRFDYYRDGHWPDFAEKAKEEKELAEKAKQEAEKAKQEETFEPALAE